MDKVIEIDALTNEVTERERTQEESEQNAKDVLEKIAIDTAKQAEAEAKEASRQVILDRLGLTAEEAQLLLGGN